VRLSLNSLTAILLLLGSGNLLYGQEAAGGSIKDFKRPANPPVYGGRIPKGNKSSTGSKGNAVEPTKPKAEEPRSTTTGLGGLGSFPRPSGAGGAATPPSSAAPAGARPAPKPQPARSAGTVNEQLEEAIAAGNDARDRRPPDYEKAEQAYRLAAKIDPQAVRAYEGLGNIFIDQKKYAEALAAYQQAVQLGSSNPQVFENLGDAYLGLGRYSESLEASNRSVALDPKSPGPYFTRAWVNLYLGNGGAAGDDARAVLERWQPQWTGELPFYVAIVGHLGYRQAGRQADADKILGEAAKACTSVAWVCRPIRYLRREQTAEELLARANDADKMTEARAYVGVDLALRGKRAEALPHLEWVKANGNPTFYEYKLAVAWLAQ
jgi:lipoprotein NlpI